MASSNIKLFDENKGNMLSDTEFNISNQRLNGLQTGVASSMLQNKAMYQTSLVAYAIAQLMLANGVNANDTDAVSAFVGNLSASIVQKVLDKASAADVANKVAGKWVDAKQLGELKTDVADNYLPLLGGTMLGDLFLNADPTQALQAVTKQYVDNGKVEIYTGTYTGNGLYGKSHPTKVIFPFKVGMFITPKVAGPRRANATEIIMDKEMNTNFVSRDWFEQTFTIYLKISDSGNEISWYSADSAYTQMNENGKIYYYAAIGVKN